MHRCRSVKAHIGLLGLSLMAAGCGTAGLAGVRSSTPTQTATHKQIAGTYQPGEDVSQVDLGFYLKVARLYCMFNVPGAELDYAGSLWLDADGLVLPKSAGWLFGYYFRPAFGDPQRREYAAVNVNQRHAVSRPPATDVPHRGAYPLYLGGMLSPKRTIAAALRQDLPTGERYAVEYLSASDSAGPMAAVTSYRNGEPAGKIYLFATTGRKK